MIEWSEQQLMIRDAIRKFIEAEIKPNLEELEHGDLPPYDILRKMMRTFGMDEVARQRFQRQIAKDKAKLLLNLVAVAPTAVPRGGDIDVEIAGTPASPGFIVRCCGPSARPPQYLGDFVNGTPPPVTALTIQAYYTVRLAAASRMRLAILKDGADVILTAKPEPAARS